MVSKAKRDVAVKLQQGGSVNDQRPGTDTVKNSDCDLVLNLAMLLK